MPLLPNVVHGDEHAGGSARLACEGLTGQSRAPANVNTGHRGRRGRGARHPQLFAVAAATPA